MATHGDLTPRVLGIAFHAIVVHIHPFIDGNGRTTRLLADLAFAATQESDELLEYDWDVDRREYIRLLGHFDLTRDTQPLVDLVGVRPVGD
ncbi:Fic family protein [Jiangella muralis]|uniref:Fic family protein n=1 Tax=Jiangella muralis TaxID=702383 RepID=UPI001969D619|nr:Fic family protein [Jiangella muralis]